MNTKLFLLPMMWVVLLLIGCSSDNDENPFNGYPEMSDPDDVCTSMNDANFMRFCYENFDINGDGKVSISEAKAVDKMEIKSSSIKSVWGIQYFDNLTDLRIDAPITYLDLSKQTKLVQLKGSMGGITSLDLSKNKELSYLFIGTLIKNLDVSNNLKLDYLDVGRGGEYWQYPHAVYPVTSSETVYDLCSLEEIWMSKGQVVKVIILDKNTVIKYK